MEEKNTPSKIGISRFFQCSANVVLTRLLAMQLVRGYIYLLGMFYVLISSGERQKLLHCQQQVLGEKLTAGRFYRTYVQTLAGIFEHYYEKLVMAHKPLARMKRYLGPRLTIANRAPLDAANCRGQGAIVVTGHFGAVEFLPLALSLHGYRIAMIVRYKTNRLKKELMARAGQLDITLIDAAESGVVFKALQALREGRMLITECDEFKEWRPSKDKQVHVFGRSIPMDKTLDFFYHKTGVPAFLALMRRDRQGYTLCIEPLAAAGAAGVSLARRAWKAMEEFISRYPCQWYQWKGLQPILALAGNGGPNTHAPRQDSYLPAENPLSHAHIA